MMNPTILTEKINAIFNAKKLFDLAREINYSAINYSATHDNVNQ